VKVLTVEPPVTHCCEPFPDLDVSAETRLETTLNFPATFHPPFAFLLRQGLFANTQFGGRLGPLRYRIPGRFPCAFSRQFFCIGWRLFGLGGGFFSRDLLLC
jgi:hypothetical protein